MKTKLVLFTFHILYKYGRIQDCNPGLFLKIFSDVHSCSAVIIVKSNVEVLHCTSHFLVKPQFESFKLQTVLHLWVCTITFNPLLKTRSYLFHNKFFSPIMFIKISVKQFYCMYVVCTTVRVQYILYNFYYFWVNYFLSLAANGDWSYCQARLFQLRAVQVTRPAPIR